MIGRNEVSYQAAEITDKKLGGLIAPFFSSPLDQIDRLYIFLTFAYRLFPLSFQ